MRYRSSGSTGTPRWHAHRLADLAQEMQVVGAVLGPVQRIVSAVPCHHIYGHLFGVLLPWARDLPDLPFLSLHGRAPLALGGQLRPGDLVLVLRRRPRVTDLFRTVTLSQASVLAEPIEGDR